MAESLPSLSNADIAVAQRLDPMMRLKPHERRFVEAYVRTSNGAESARQAGYSKNGAAVRARSLLQREEIQHAITELMVAQAIARGVTVDRLVAELAVLSLDRENVDPKDRIKAIDLLMRHMGAYNDKLSISLDDPDVIEMAKLTGQDPQAIVHELETLGIQPPSSDA